MTTIGRMLFTEEHPVVLKRVIAFTTAMIPHCLVYLYLLANLRSTDHLQHHPTTLQCIRPAMDGSESSERESAGDVAYGCPCRSDPATPEIR